MNPSAVLLVASPRGFYSTSHSLGSYLLDKLQQGGYTTNKYHIQAALHKPEMETEMLNAVTGCDLLIIAFPLYIDCLPAPLIAALEKISEQRKTALPTKSQKLIAIVNNGFPEASQNSTAIAICHEFAIETGFTWAGGLSLGGGGIISGAPLEKAGFMARNALKALNLAAENLLIGADVSEEAVKLMAKPAIPKSLYIFAGNRGWKSLAKKYGTEEKLYDKPAKN